jgi:hypothetical protein
MEDTVVKQDEVPLEDGGRGVPMGLRSMLQEGVRDLLGALEELIIVGKKV